MKKSIGFISVFAWTLVLAINSSKAELVPRMNGLVVYDTDRDISWLANANLAVTNKFGVAGISSNGGMTWSVAKSWIAAMNSYGGTGYLGFNDWTLPTVLHPDASCTNDPEGTTSGGPNSAGYNCSGSDMGHLFYNELGGTAGSPVSISADPDLALFSNLQTIDFYWTDRLFDSTTAWIFHFGDGSQRTIYYRQTKFAMAMRHGDVALNEPPVAVPGPKQSVHPGSTVFLDGSASYDDNTPSENLLYQWVFVSSPDQPQLFDDNAAKPYFFAVQAGTYEVGLTVTDTEGLKSEQKVVTISTDNLAPTARILVNNSPVNSPVVLVVLGSTVNLDGSTSSDPESDPLTYAWTLSIPSGSNAALSTLDKVTSSFVPDRPGAYEVSLGVSDLIGPGESANVKIIAATPADYAVQQILSASNIVTALSLEQVSTRGNQTAFMNFLGQAILAIQDGDLLSAIDKVEKSMARTDGCIPDGSTPPDGNGPGRDWITDCSAQIQIYDLLHFALDALDSALAQ